MKLILKIAAGVVIGLLTLQIIFMKLNPPDLYDKKVEELNHVMALKNKFIRLQTAINYYYKQNHTLPMGVRGLSCSKMLGENYGGPDIKASVVPCAETMINGEFFVTHNNLWASVVPYVVNNKVRFKCTTTVAFVYDDRYSHCKVVDVDDVLERVAEMTVAETAEQDEIATDAPLPVPVVRAKFPGNISGRWVASFLPSEAVRLPGGERVNELVIYISSGQAKIIANTTAGGEYVIGDSVRVHQYEKSFSLTLYSGPGGASEVWSIAAADVGDVDLGVTITVVRRNSENGEEVERVSGIIKQ